jgi:protein-tyrosine phosphatase
MLALDRHLEWEGCFNARDLGGLPVRDGGRTRHGAIVRADDLDRLTQAGWAALQRHGVRTIVDLRNDPEIDAARVARRPAGVAYVHVPLDDAADTAFWEHCWENELDGSPLYYRPFLERKPERCAAAVRAIAAAGPGAVAFHCGGGRDRTGLVALLLLALAGVETDAIVADYQLSPEPAEVAAILERRRTSAAELLCELLEWLDTVGYLSRAGLRENELEAVRRRLV